MFYAPDSITFDSVVAATTSGLWSALATLLSIALSLNILLAVFNLLPFPPLDGSGAIPLFLSAENTRKYQDFLWTKPGVGWIGILIAWQLFGYVFDPVWTGIVNLLHPGVTYG